MPSTRRKHLLKLTADPQRLLVIIDHRSPLATTHYKWWPSSSMIRGNFEHSQHHGQHQQAIWYRIKRIFEDNLSCLQIPWWLQGNKGPMAATVMNGALVNHCIHEKPQGNPVWILTPEAACHFLWKSVPRFPHETLQCRPSPPWQSHRHWGNHRMLAEMSAELQWKSGQTSGTNDLYHESECELLAFFVFVALA